MNKFIKILALTVATGSVVTLAACGVSSSNKSATSANWNTRVTANDLNSSSEWLTGKECATYAVSYKKGANTAFSLDYDCDSAQYSTVFYAKQFDWATDTRSEFIAEGKEYVYVYETSLDISGTYTKGEEVHAFTDSVTTVSYFRSASKNLQPIYSKQVIKNTAPAAPGGGYITLDSVYETHYSKDCKKAITVETPASGEATEKTVSTSSSYSLYDSSYSGIFLRAMAMTGTHSFRVFTPQSATMVMARSSGEKAAVLNRESEAMIAAALDAAVAADYLYVADKDENDVNVYSYNAITYGSGDAMAGPSFTYWFATVKSDSFNAARGVMLKYVMPMSFNAGSLTFTLRSLEKQALTT